ncbi:MAG: DNA-binding response regulator [Acidobacteria bacterium]|nr:MAG: DNA-binding response regulator [Acidobacteriota bacterium]
MSRPRLLIADDHRLLVEGYRKLLETEFDVVGEVEDGRALLELAPQLQPDVILLDVSMPLLNGIEAARRLKPLLPDTKLLFVSMHADSQYVAEAFRAGGSGYLLKSCASSELVSAIHQVLQGRQYVTPAISTGELAQTAEVRPGAILPQLSPRQREVLQLVTEGQTAKEIAGRLRISVKTVEFHKTRIMRALRVRSVAELTRYAVTRGLVSP